MDMKDRFEQFADEFLKFDRIEAPRSKRRDLHAFLLLDELQQAARPLISASEHDEFYLDIRCNDEFAAAVTDDQIRDLMRCGVRYDGQYECLCMFA